MVEYYDGGNKLADAMGRGGGDGPVDEDGWQRRTGCNWRRQKSCS